MSSDDIKLRTRPEPVAAPAADSRFEPAGALQVGGAPTPRRRFTRRELIVAFVLFNLVVWSSLIWLLLR